jgi:lantibiotic modifying enzyme
MRDALGHLTGFAHGSAGNAYALLALHAVAPDPALRDAVAGAIAYETTTFSAQHGNWPDLRYFGTGPREAGYTTAWCHGAIGILRARLFAEAHGFDVGGDIEAALATTASHLELILAEPYGDMTLCHGAFGAADALLEGVRSGRAAYAPLVARCAAHGTERYHRGDRPWPSGLLTREEVDNLMLGNSGIGHAYLRLADPSLRSMLAPA